MLIVISVYATNLMNFCCFQYLYYDKASLYIQIYLHGLARDNSILNIILNEKIDN